MFAGSNVPFSAAPLAQVGIGYNPALSEVIIDKDGYYGVTFGVSQTNAVAAVMLFVNGVKVPNTNIIINGANVMTVAAFTLPLHMNDALALKNNGTASFNLQSAAGSGSTDRPTLAFLKIERLGDL